MELDVATPAVARRRASRRAQIVGKAVRGRVIEIDGATGLIRSRAQPDIELIVYAWFARVFGANVKEDVTVQVCPGRATDVTRTHRLAGLGVNCVLVIGDVVRDAGRVNVEASGVVEILQVAPVRYPIRPRTVLAAATDAKVGVGAEGDDEAATGQKVARRQPSLHRGRSRANHQHRPRHQESSSQKSGQELTYGSSAHCSFSLRL